MNIGNTEGRLHCDKPYQLDWSSPEGYEHWLVSHRYFDNFIGLEFLGRRGSIILNGSCFGNVTNIEDGICTIDTASKLYRESPELFYVFPDKRSLLEWMLEIEEEI